MGVRLRRFEFRRLEFELPTWLQSDLLLLGLPRRQYCEQLLERADRRECSLLGIAGSGIALWRVTVGG